MALLFCDSFDHYTTAQLPVKGWKDAHANVTIDDSLGRDGGAALRLGAGVDVSVTRAVPERQAVHVGLAVYVSALPGSAFPVLTFLDGASAQCVLELNADGTVTLRRGATVLGSSTATVPAAVYGYLEVRLAVDTSQGNYIVRWNEATILSGTGVNTQETVNAFVDGLKIQALSAAGEHLRVDDFYLADDQGPANTALLGDIEVIAHYPNADGQYSDFEGPETDKYTRLAETPLNTNSYLHSTVGNHAQTNAFEDLDETVVTVLALQSVAAVRRVGTAEALAAPMAVDTFGGAVIVGDPVPAPDDPVFLLEPHDLNPVEGAPWTRENATPFEFGLQHALEPEEG